EISRPHCRPPAGTLNSCSAKGLRKSGREDLNLRPHGPEPCALAKLSYAPFLAVSRCILQASVLLSIGSRKGETAPERRSFVSFVGLVDRLEVPGRLGA